MKMANDPIDDLQTMMKEVAESLFPTSMVDTELKNHIKAVRESVEKDKLTSFLPRIALTCKHGTEAGMCIMPIPQMPDENSKKQHLMNMLGIAAAANDLHVMNAIFIVEAWSRASNGDDPETKKLMSGEKRVSDMPDKQEIIMLTSMTMDKRSALATIPITGRNSDDSLILGPESFHGNDSETKVKDSLLTAFWEGFLLAEGTKIAAKMIDARGEELPPDVIKMLEIMESAPKLKKIV
jgi:hypothetical protein